MTSSHTIDHISVIELDFHHDSLDGFLKIFQDTTVKLSVFTTAKNIKFLSGVHYSNNITFYSYSGGLKYFFLRKHSVIINSSQIIFINTIANDFGAYIALDNKAKIVLRVHNVNKQFAPLSNIYFPKSLYFTWKFFSYIARQVAAKGFLVFRPIVNQKVNCFTFPDDGIADYVRHKGFIEENRILPSIPLKIFIEDDTAFEEYNNVLNITIIGATDERRRKYDEVIEALTQLYKSQNPPSIHLTLLGNSNNAYGKSIIEQLNEINHSNFRLTTFNKQVAESDFIKCVKHTHLIISPITDKATTDIFKEIYGKTKTTGSILDFLKFGKVTLVPSHYSPPKELNEYIIQYNGSENLKNILQSIVDDKNVNDLNKKAMAFVKHNYSQQAAFQLTMNAFMAVSTRP